MRTVVFVLVFWIGVLWFLATLLAQPIPPYDRADWGGWIDADGDGQDTRQEVLIDESLIPVATNRNGTRVLSGKWHDPYTGLTIRDPRRLDIDHRIPLAIAHISGGWAWDSARKESYANDLSDPGHLVAVSAGANRQKGARDPSAWLPPVNVCAYVFAWIRVKSRWALSYDDAEAQALVREIAACLN
jgi:hypothetical protein